MVLEGPVWSHLLKCLSSVAGSEFHLNRILEKKIKFCLFFQKTRGMRGPARAKAAVAAAKEEEEEDKVERMAANQSPARGCRRQHPPTARTRQVS